MATAMAVAMANHRTKPDQAMVATRISGRAIAIGFVATAIAIVAGRSAASQVFAPAKVNGLSAFAANDGEALTKRFDAAFLRANGNPPDAERWLKQARLVLAHNPLSADVVRIAALASIGTGADLGTIRSRMTLSERVSARDLPAQLWLLEDAVGQGNVDKTLQHYDRALAVFPRVKAQLYPVLSGALADRNIRLALSPYIRAGRPWAYEFIGYAIDQAAETADVADLMILSGGSRTIPGNRPLETMMLNKLVSNGRYQIASRYARSMVTKAAAEAATSDFRFSEATMDPALRPFTWSTTEDLSIRATFSPGEGLTAIAGSGIGAVAADRVMLLQPGRYRFAQKVDLPRLSPMVDATWSASCLSPEGARPVWTQAVPQQPGEHSYRTTFNLPAGCEATRFRLTVRGADVQEDSMITIRSVGLAPG